MSRIGTTFFRAVANAGLAFAAVALTVFFVAASLADGSLGYDMITGLLPASDLIVDGVSPLPGITYPPLLPFLLVPFTFVPEPGIVLGFLALLCVPASLWALDVRDWRCYAAAFVWAPVSSGIETANPTLFLVFAGALAWRFRNAPIRAATSAGLAIAAKAISVPLVVWLAATRRMRAGTAAVVIAVAATGAVTAVDRLALERSSGSWGVLTVPGSAATGSYGISDIVRALGGGNVVALLALAVVVVAVLGLVVRYGRQGDDSGAFAAAAVATLVVAPNVWMHSFSFLLLVVAARRPRLSAPWLAPPFLFFLPVTEPTLLEALVGWAVALALIVPVLLRPAPAPERAPEWGVASPADRAGLRSTTPA